MSASSFLRHAAAGAAISVLCAGAAAQPLPNTSLNKAGPTRAYTFGTAPAKSPTIVNGGCAPDGLCLVVTLGLADASDPSLCASTTSLAVDIGDQVNVCYTVTNHSSVTLNYQSLSDDHVGQLLTNSNVALAPGASYQYNRTITASTNPASDTGTFTSTWTANDILPGYVPNDTTPYAFVDISATGTGLSLSDDGAQSVTMPFAFPFYSANSNILCIGNNGELRLGASGCSTSPYNNSALPSTGLNGPAILPYWDDMLPGGTVYYATVGTAPNRQFIVEYKNKLVYGDHGDPTGQTGATWEAILNEADSTIAFQYQTAGFGGAGANYDNGVAATVGLQSSGTFANQYSYNTASLHDGLAISWTPASPSTYTSTAAATLDVGSPTMITTPNGTTGFSPTVSADSITTAPLLIDNIGNRDLDWSLTPPSARAHFPKTPRTTVPFHGPWDGIRFSPPDQRKPSTMKALAPSGTVTVPTYAAAVTVDGADYVMFDAANPGVSNMILHNSVVLFGTTFVDNDFTTQYGVDYLAGNLYSLSTLDGTATLIGNTGLVSCCYVVPGGMRWDPTTGTTFLIINDFHAGGSRKLYSIDLATAATTLVGSLSGAIRDIAIDQSGLMYGIDSDADTLVAIDKTSGAVQTIGSLGFDAVFGQGLDFDAQTGVLYLASATESTRTMYTVDPLTGTATYLGDMASEVDSMAIAIAGLVCSTPADTPWLGYDITSGTVTPDPDLTHPATVNVSFDATDLAPGTYTANVCVYGNDPAHARAAIPVTLTVNPSGPVDEIFNDGFEGTGLPGGTTPIAQTTDTTPVALNSAACGDNTTGTTADNQYWRRYTFSEYSVPTPASVASVDVSIEKTTGSPNITVTLYTIPHSVTVDTIALAQLSQIGQATIAAPADTTLTTFNVPVSGTVTDTTANDLVVEVSSDDGSSDGSAFYIGSTLSPETHPSFLSSTACMLGDPTPTSAIGFPNMHIIEAVNIND